MTLQISNLKLGYAGKTVLELPKLSIKKSNHQLIIGNSGRGKTTLLYALAGLLKPISGSINIAGTEITKLNGAEKDKFRGQHIGIVFQTLHMVSAISVLENILISPMMSGKPQNKAKAFELLELMGIADLADKKPNEISHGQAQRVAIARAAISSPDIILADEPTSALDDKSCKAVIKLLLSVAESAGSSLIVASHDSRIKPYFDNTLNLGAGNE